MVEVFYDKTSKCIWTHNGAMLHLSLLIRSGQTTFVMGRNILQFENEKEASEFVTKYTKYDGVLQKKKNNLQTYKSFIDEIEKLKDSKAKQFETTRRLKNDISNLEKIIKEREFEISTLAKENARLRNQIFEYKQKEEANKPNFKSLEWEHTNDTHVLLLLALDAEKMGDYETEVKIIEKLNKIYDTKDNRRINLIKKKRFK